MLEVRVKQLKEQAHEDFRYYESLIIRLVPFVRKEMAKKEVAKKEAAEKETTKKEAAQKEVTNKEDDDDEEDQA
jgi:hypothetical protein